MEVSWVIFSPKSVTDFPKIGGWFPQSWWQIFPKLVAGLFSPKLVAAFPKVDGLFAQSRCWFPQSRWRNWRNSTKLVAEFPNCLQVSMKLRCVDWFVPCSWLFFSEWGFEPPFDLQWNNTNILWLLHVYRYTHLHIYIYNHISCYMHQPWCHAHTSWLSRPATFSWQNAASSSLRWLCPF